MPIKKKIKKLKEEILNCYLEGMTQDEIIHKYEPQLKKSKLKVLVKESEFLAPKNFRLGSILLFIVTLLTPGLSAYLRGFIYREITGTIFIISTIFALPYLVFCFFFYSIRDIRKLKFIAIAFIAYQLIVIAIYILISIDLKLWTMSMFLVILFPTFVAEYFKLERLIKKIATLSPTVS